MSFVARPVPEPAPALRVEQAPEVERLLASCLRDTGLPAPGPLAPGLRDTGLLAWGLRVAATAPGDADAAAARPAAPEARARAFLIAGRLVGAPAARRPR